MVTALGVGALAFWSGTPAPARLAMRVPGMDSAPSEASSQVADVSTHGVLQHMDGLPAEEILGSWPCFRGEFLDNISRDTTPLARSWGDNAPKALWSVELGEGYAGPAVRRGRVYLLDYDAEKKMDALRCLSLADGREIWRYSYPVVVKRNHGMSRTVPAVTDEFVVSLGPKCHVTCLDAATGELRWQMDLVRQFGTTVPAWYAGQCPIIDGTRVIIAPAGDVLMMAVELGTGQIIWKTPNPRGWKMSHSSITPMELAGRRQYVYCAAGGVVGVDPEDGSILWDTDAWKVSIATVPCPVPVGDDRIFLCGSYNSGCMMLKVKADGGRYRTEVLWKQKQSVFGSEQHTPVFFEGYLYGVRPDGELVCLDLDGRIKWTSASRRFEKGYGPWMLAQRMLYVMDSEGTLTLVAADPSAYRELARAKVLEGHESWGPMALVSGRLLVRDLTRMVCLDVSEKGVSP